MSQPERRWILVDDTHMEEAFIGFRAWRVEAVRGDVHLTSVVALTNHIWPKDSPMEATCIDIFGGHTDAPADDCKCGIWAHDELRRTRLTFMQRYFVYGEVALWGKVKVHTNGMRASRARPTALFAPRTTGPKHEVNAQRMLVELAASQYNIPLVHSPAPDIERLR